ncbi:hypothetical protein LAh8_17 [Aeromonas phage LAh_8]|uniref:Uncharacterized protein n=1 Tax=Aeromonas phage LAh_8 TaxID=2591032 RepID=A0A514A0S3_9CAUD|nr:hypothetical protein HWC31_gp017 [Aeromonas phage LAh_8]QDH46835.1 hypothetical protein LAh8_17 [Aeromonas phage LAh_8]
MEWCRTHPRLRRRQLLHHQVIVEAIGWLVIILLATHNLILAYNIRKMGEVLVSMGEELDELQKDKA